MLLNSSFAQTFKLGLKSLFLQKLRSGLAALGIIIGTTAVIWLVACGEGASYQAQQRIKELGATNIIVKNVKPVSNDQSDNARVQRYGLLRSDYERMLTIPTVKRAVPMRDLTRKVRVGDRSVDANLVGCTSEYLELNRLDISRGRWFNAGDRGENVAVLGAAVASTIYPVKNAIGKTIWLGSDLYTVIGQTRERSASVAIGGSMEAHEYNMDIYIPLSTVRKRVGDFIMERKPGSFTGEIVELCQVTVAVDKIDDVDVTANVIKTQLERFHDQEDYEVVVPKALLAEAEAQKAIFNTLLVVIAGISLLVGGIGIMNIMLATVTERTREIGVRRALGARRSHIVQQFLTETTVLTATGGLIGVLLGLCIGPIVTGLRWACNTYSPELLPPILQTLEPRIAPWSVILALCISIGVGLIFGVYPARQAAYMDPIEALRHE